MSCFFGHRWSRWEEIKREAHLGDGRIMITRYQRRKCKKCGYIQEHIISR